MVTDIVGATADVVVVPVPLELPELLPELLDDDPLEDAPDGEFPADPPPPPQAVSAAASSKLVIVLNSDIFIALFISRI